QCCSVHAVLVLGAVLVSVLFVFFFQAEDGIRDWSVTGVQTCALPISRAQPSWRRARPSPAGRGGAARTSAAWPRCPRDRARAPRSEERRVGEEGGSWGGRDR